MEKFAGANIQPHLPTSFLPENKAEFDQSITERKFLFIPLFRDLLKCGSKCNYGTRY
jgi:hypothetical protein